MEIFPKTVSITVHGPRAVLDTLSSGDFSILLDLDGKKAGTYVLAPDIIVPEGIASFTVDVDSIRVLLTDAADAQSMN